MCTLPNFIFIRTKIGISKALNLGWVTNMVNISVVDDLSECIKGSLLVGPRSLTPTTNKTKSKYAIISNYDDWFSKKKGPICKPGLETLDNGKNCILLNECVEYLVGEVWLKSEITKNSDDTDSFRLTFYKDHTCTSMWKEHTLKDFVPDQCYKRPWGLGMSISIGLANECPKKVTYFGNLNDDDDIMSTDDFFSDNDDDDDNVYYADDIYDNDDMKDYQKTFSTVFSSSKVSDADETFHHSILTVVGLLGLFSVGVVIVNIRRTSLDGYTTIQPFSVTTEATGI